MNYVADVGRVHGEYEAAVAVSVDTDAGISTVWRSLDGASDPKSTLDVSGVSRSDRVIGLLARSTDRGRRRELVRGPGAMAGETPTAGSAVTTHGTRRRWSLAERRVREA